MKREIKAVVFDIGGVLIDNADMINFWRDSKESKILREKFGSGKITTNQFISRGAKLFGLTQKEFLERYKETYFTIKPKKEVIKIFKKIKLDKYILSDTNPLVSGNHFIPLREIRNLAKKCFLSHKIKMRKTSLKTFSFLIKEIGATPKSILFIDDNKEHLERAKIFGIQTIWFRNSSQLSKDLRKLKII